jgi:hypothetical protein
MLETRRFPPPWTVEEYNDACFIVRDHNGQQLAYVYFEDEPTPLHRFYQRTQRFGFANNGPAIFQFDDALMLPTAKAAVDFLTRSSHHFRQFTL